MKTKDQSTLDKSEYDAFRIREVAEAIADKTDAAPYDQKARVFYDGVRASIIPYLPCYLDKQVDELYARSFDAFYHFGRASVPLTVALTMHQYNLAALATMPVPQEPEFERRRKILVDTIRKYRSLLAISSFGENIKNKDAGTKQVRVEITPEGTLICRGRKPFQSMASEADLLLFSGLVGDSSNMGMFWTTIKDQPNIEVGPSLFKGGMELADTRPIEFKGLVLKQRSILSLTDHLTDHISFYATAWFEALIAAAYLGGASRAIEEVRKFAHSVHMSDGETMLAELDGFIVECGRLNIKLLTALSQARTFGWGAQRYCDAITRGGASVAELDGVGSDIMDCASAIKYHSTQTAVEIVNAARTLIGTRSMVVGHKVRDLTEQAIFGPMHPSLPAHFERSAGHDVLNAEKFVGLYQWGFG